LQANAPFTLSTSFHLRFSDNKAANHVTLEKKPTSDLARFREHFSSAKHLVILTGAGVSAESGVPTFRGAGGFWRTYKAQDLATPEAFDEDPSLVWEFYHYRREVMISKSPNAAHAAIADVEARFAAAGKRVVIITQNIDELHKRAGSENILELHGSLFKTRCTKCEDVRSNHDSPICEALRGYGAPDPNASEARLPTSSLPRCQTGECGGLLRPHVVWFGEGLDKDVLRSTDEELEKCDLCLVVGTSSIVYPAAMFAPQVARRGVPVAEFNMETTPATSQLGPRGFFFQGPCGTTLPQAMAE
jgi:NAD-dependent deacetylase sirtuin 5